MTSPDADLATLEEAFRYAQGFDVAGWEGHLPTCRVRDVFDHAHTRVEAEIARLQQAELNGRIDLERYEHLHDDYKAMLKRAEAAERRVVRLREGLRWIAESGGSQPLVDKARALLAEDEA